MELPLYQKHLIEAMRLGNNVFMDNFEKLTYHIRINESFKEITQHTISTLQWRGLVKLSGNSIVLTELGLTAELTSPNDENKTLYSVVRQIMVVALVVRPGTVQFSVDLGDKALGKYRFESYPKHLK